MATDIIGSGNGNAGVPFEIPHPVIITESGRTTCRLPFCFDFQCS